jgi:hypothetical protein
MVRIPGYRSRGYEFDSRRYQIIWEVVGLQLRPLSLVRTTEELLRRKIEALVKKTESTAVGDPQRWLGDTFYPQKSD